MAYVVKARVQSLDTGEPFSEVFTSITNATVEFAEACHQAQQNGRSQRTIAETAGCSQFTVCKVLQALDRSSITGNPFSEVFTSITNASRKLKSSTEGSGGRTASPAVVCCCSA